MIVVYVILAVLAAFLLLIICRTLAFTPKKAPHHTPNEVTFDKEKATENLRTLIKFKTVSHYFAEEEAEDQFRGLLDALPILYPALFKICEYRELADRAVLIRWKGKNSTAPTVLMAHYDVVPADEAAWEKPPFDAVLEDGVLWGRGTLDTKVTLNSALFAANQLTENGFVPENDVYFAFSGGEEVNGKGAVNIVNYFKENNISPAMVVDEGGAVVENVFPGVKGQCALIGIAEKGLLNVSYTALSEGGHASAPKPGTPLIRLSRAILKIEGKPFKMHVTTPVAKMFDTLGRHSSFAFRMIFANLWCFGWVLNLIAKKSGGEMNALLRTTVAFTKAQGSNARNVIPPKAEFISNIRLNPNDTIDSAINRLNKTVGDEKVKITMLEGTNPSSISVTDCKEWEKLSRAVADTWQGSIVSPYLMVQCSDSRHYNGFCDKVYRFSCMDLTSEERATIHGHNERIRLDCLYRSVEFYIRLINML